jgi:predicted patatin/cPLA2 family phospholipase
MYSIIQSIESRGILNIKIFEEIFEPLFLSKNIDINITLKELYELTHIDIHIFATELNTFKLIDICHTDYPDWRVIDAVYASSSVPLLFAPLLKDSKCYLDGGFLLNYPMSECIRHGKNVNEIFGICQQLDKIHTLHIREESTLFDYIFALLNKIVLNILNVYTHEHLKYEIKINTVKMGLYAIFEFASSKDKRIEMIDIGVNQCIEYFDSIQQP